VQGLFVLFEGAVVAAEVVLVGGESGRAVLTELGTILGQSYLCKTGKQSVLVGHMHAKTLEGF